MRQESIKKTFATLLLLLLVPVTVSCGQHSRVADPAEKKPESTVHGVANCAGSRLLVLPDGLYTIKQNELLCRAADRDQTEVRSDLADHLGAPLDDFMLFYGKDTIWLLSQTGRGEAELPHVQLSSLNPQTGKFAEQTVELNAWPAAAALLDHYFFYSQEEDESLGKHGLYKLDLSDGRLELINKDDVLSLLINDQRLSYLPLPMEYSEERKIAVPVAAAGYIHEYDPAASKGTKTAVQADLPAFAVLHNQYVTVDQTDDPVKNHELRLQDASGRIVTTYPFGSGLSWPSLISSRDHLALLIRENSGDKLILLNDRLSQEAEWGFKEGQATRLEAMDNQFVYLSQTAAGPEEKDMDVSQTVAYYRVPYADQNSIPEEIFPSNK